MTLKVHGMEGLQRQLREIGYENSGKILQRSARRAFRRVLEAARALVPVETGELRDALAIASAKAGEGDGVAVVGLVVTAGGSGAKQARVAAAAFGEGQSTRLPPSRRWHFVEFGTSKMPAKPFARPALDENVQGVVDDLGLEVWRGVLRALKKGR